MPKPKKYKWKCKKCKKSNFVKENVIKRHIKDFDEHTTDTAIIELPCGRCHDKTYIEVSGLLQTGLWKLRPIKASQLKDPRAVVSKDVALKLDEVRMLMAQGRVAPWSDIHSKETILIYQVYVEDGAILTRLRTHMMTEPLMNEAYHVLERDIAEPYLEMIRNDLEKFDKRIVSGGDSE
jgi:hypothetical protein